MIKGFPEITHSILLVPILIVQLLFFNTFTIIINELNPIIVSLVQIKIELFTIEYKILRLFL